GAPWPKTRRGWYASAGKSACRRMAAIMERGGAVGGGQSLDGATLGGNMGPPCASRPARGLDGMSAPIRSRGNPMWDAIRYAGTPLTLVAFLAALTAVAYFRRLKQRADVLAKVPEKDRAGIVDKELETYTITKDNLSRQQKFDLMMEVMRRKAERVR